METQKSMNWKNWKAFVDLKTCMECRKRNGKIYAMDEQPYPEPPLHPNCRCTIIRMNALTAGTATKKGEDGADFWLKRYGKLPEYYILKKEAERLGWKIELGNLSKVVPNKMVFDEYRNANRKLPAVPNRKWYEADINYTSGYRNNSRILFSSDGLIFVTYDHYKTFIEIV